MWLIVGLCSLCARRQKRDTNIDRSTETGFINSMPWVLAALLILASPAHAMFGGAQPAGKAGQAVVLLVGSRGTSCSGVALARELILTAGHCVLPGADYKLVEFDVAHRPL